MVGLDQYMALDPSNSSNLGQLALSGLSVKVRNTYLPTIRMSRDLNHAHLGTVCHRHKNTSRVNPCTKFDDSILAIPETFEGVYNFEMDHVTRATPFSWMVSHPKANT